MNTIINEFEQLEIEDKICGICACIKENEIVLSCKHSFCYECIYDWLNMKKKKTTFHDKNSTLLECPYCKQKINKLPLLEKYKYIRGITEPKQIIPKKLNKNTQNISNKDNKVIQKSNINLMICNAPIKSKNNILCQSKGKECFGYYCGRHKKYHKLKPKVNSD